MRFVLLAALCLAVLSVPASALPPLSTSLNSVPITANTGEKPQSKVWTYDGKWWCVLPNSSGTWIWRLDGSAWNSVLKLSTATSTHADVKSVGPVVHVLLYNGVSSALASAEYVPLSQTYQAWTTRPANVPITLDTGVETATIDVDSQGRMWLASDVVTDIVVRYSDSPYSSWSAPVNLANNVNSDDISVVTAMPGNKIGVLWSNQATKRFGFRTHLDGTDPTLWTPDEVPASQSAIDNVGAGMADDHLNVAVASDGTLYAAVKTGYDTAGYPKIAFLVRRPAGTWDNLYGVDEAGSRGICLLDEAAGTVAVVYMSVEGSGNIIYKETPISSIAFGSTRNTLISGSLAEPTSTKQNIVGSVVVLATSGSNAVGVLRYGSDVTAPTVGLTSPNGGESWVIGSIHNILWTATDDVGVTGVDLEYSTNGGSGWSAIASGLANTGSYAWTVPGPATTQARVRVTARDAAGHSAQAASAANFEIRAVATFTITASAGAGGSISPSGSVPVVEGGSQPFTIAPDGTHHIGDVLVDGVSQGPIGAYLFSNVTADHTIAASFVPDGGPADLAGWWPLDEGTGTIAHDLSGLGNDGTIVGSPLWVPAVKNLGLQLNGSSQYVTVPNSASLDITSAITLAAWIRPTMVKTASIIDKAVFASGVYGYELNLSSGGYPFCRFYNDALTPGGGRLNATALYPTDGTTWMHVAATYDGSMTKIYINGVLDKSNTCTAPIPSNPSLPLTIGAPSDGLAARVFPGAIDDARVYGRALSAAEILALARHTITASAGSGGSISPSGAVLVAHAASQAFAITADPGHSIADVLVDGVSVGAVASYTFSNVTADHTIAASFTGTTFTITASAGSGGSISPSGSVSVPAGGSKDFTITPDGCYTIADVLVDGVSVGAVASYTFNNVTADHTIAASFALRTYTIAASAGAGGSITPSGNVTVDCDGSQPFTIAPDGTHHIGDVLVDGVSQGPIGAYLFSNVTADHTIAASFVPDGGPVDLAGWWPLDEGSGTVAHDLSGLGNDGAVVGSPLWVPAVKNLGLRLNGTNQYALVPTDPTLDLTDAITLSTWIKPEAYTGTPQDLIKKGNNGGTNGYELTLSSTGSTWPQKVFLRFNQVTSGDTYRINSTTLYPYDGNTWLHVAGTYDGAMMRLYINGVEEASKAMAVPIATNTDPLGIGVQSNVQRFFKGTMDDVRVYGRALSAAEILALASHTITASAGSGGSISPSGAVLVAHTASQGFTIAADPGYSIADVLVDGVSVGAVASYTFSNVTADHTIAASFTGSTFTITASAGSGGTIAPSGSVSVPSGGEKTFTIAPDGCHTIADVLVDGVSVGAVASYTFSNVTANHTIAASFALKTHTIAASAGAGGSISPSGNVSVTCGGEQAFAIAPDGCHTIADVLVDGVSVGAVASYAFSGVTADHTIAASFALKTYTIAASAGAGGGISPSGNVTVSCGGEQVFAITADDCYAIADVLVDGVAVGAVASYTFSNVTANHTIAASFALKTYTIAASAGAGGGISPSGNVTVDCGGEQSFAIAANVGFVISQVLVDGIPAGPVASYTFTTVTENHTIAAAFVQVGPSLDVIAPVAPPGAAISTATPCVAVPVVFTRTDPTPLRGYSVTLELSPNLSLCGAQFASAGYTRAPRQFLATPLGGNRWTVDDVTLGEPCGATGSGTVFLVYVASSEPTGTGTLTVLSVLARDCMNQPLPGVAGPAATIPIDNLGPVRTLDLTALQSKSGNYLPPPGGPHERTAIQLTFAVPPDAATVEVYRKEFGGYPQYDENGGAVPALPASLPAPGWVRTEVTASGQTDEPPVRDYWYYALVTKDAYSNRSVVSNMTGGTLDYHLGDVHDGTAECAGDDQVTMTDVSFLHAHYGATVPVNDALECLDVGATLDMSTNLRPTTDNVIEFEDLMMFALNYGGVSAPQPPLRDESLASGGIDRVTLGMPPTVSPGEVFDVYMTLEPGGVLQGLSVKLGWDPAVAEPLSTTPGVLFEAEGGVTWSPGMTTVDGALLGVRSQGLLQNGTFGVVQFRALAAGDPQVHVASFRARDRFNAPLPLELAVTGADPQLPLRTELALAKPTPFAGSTTLEYSLAVRGQAELVVFGVDGRRVRTLQHGMQEPGVYRFSWDGADAHGRAVPAGVYFVRLSTGGDRFTRTLVRLGH